MAWFMLLEEHRAESGTERERGEARDQRRGGNRDRKLAKEQAGYPGEKRRWHEHGAQRQRNRDQRSADLVHGDMGGLGGSHSTLQVAFDILDHDDRVVDDDADREHEPEQGQVVERDAEGVEDSERADQGDRNGDHRDDGGAPTLQKQEHDADDQQDRDENRGDHLVHRFADEYRGIVDDLVADAWRELLGERLHGRQHLVLDRQGIGARLGEDEQRQAWPAIHEGGRAVIGGADLDTSDIAQTRDAALGVGFEDDRRELLGRAQPAQSLHVELIGLL